ncbi:MAG: hypothetical protein B7Z77_04205 [Acidocella sp. 20-58-15]|nr:MAG: hypothetical protein B7Z77_04205 [Acidocella sp. 20-58-15]
MIDVDAPPLVIALAMMIGLAGCTTVLSDHPVSVPLTQTTIGSVEPVYNPPPNTPFRCVGTPTAITLSSVPGDPNTPLPAATAPVATMGNRRGDWLLIVTHTGEVGWFYDPQEESFAQEYPGMGCHVHQDAEGRIVFDYKLTHGSF